MNWDAIGAVSESIGAFAVLASLLYLAIQIRSNTRVARSDSETQFQIYWNSHIQKQWFADGERASLFRRALRDWHALSRDEQGIAHSLLGDTVDSQRIAMRLNRNGQIGDDLREAVDVCVGAIVKTRGGMQWWSEIKQFYIHRDAIDRLVAREDIPPIDSVSFFAQEP